MLTETDIKELEMNRRVLAHFMDAEPVNSKSKIWEILIWSLDTLAPILIKNGKYSRPGLFSYFKLVTFSIALIKKINEALKHKSKT